MGGKGGPPRPVYRSEIPSPRAKDPVKVSALSWETLEAAMIGRSTSTETPQPVVVTSVLAFGSKVGTANLRTVPETPRAIASSALLAPPSVRYAFRHGRFSFTPA